MASRTLGILCVVGYVAWSLGCAGLERGQDRSAELTEFCSKAASEHYAVGNIVHPLELRTWVLQAAADKEPNVARRTADYYTELLAPVNPYLAYSFYHVYGGEAPTDTEVLAWFPDFVRAVVSPESPEVPRYLSGPPTLRETGPFLNAILMPSKEPHGERLFRACLKLIDPPGEFNMLRGAILILMFETYRPYRELRLEMLQDIYDEYVLAAMNGRIPNDMSFVEFLATFAARRFADAFPGVDLERVREEWAAERESATP